MLEYSIDEAERLLKKNQETASTNLKQVEADMDFLREQITTMEVSILPLFTAANPSVSAPLYTCTRTHARAHAHTHTDTHTHTHARTHTHAHTHNTHTHSRDKTNWMLCTIV